MCQKTTTINQIPQDLVVFDVAGAAIRNEPLREISSQINYAGYKYKLLRVVEHIGSIKHFVSHILRPTGDWYKFDDLASNIKKSQVSVEAVSLIVYRLIQ